MVSLYCFVAWCTWTKKNSDSLVQVGGEDERVGDLQGGPQTMNLPLVDNYQPKIYLGLPHHIISQMLHVLIYWPHEQGEM